MVEQTNHARSDTLVDVSPLYGHLLCFRGLLPLIIRTAPHTYISTSDGAGPLDTTWLALAFAGMEYLRSERRDPVRSVAVIGTGSGLDAVGISHIFAPEQMIASDLHAGTLDAARWNIAKYAARGTRCSVLQSDLFRRYPSASAFDLVYENLPNIPDEEDLFEGIRAASYYQPASYRADPVSDGALLTLHHNFLLEARSHLHPHGSVVCMIGGRVPWMVIQEIFARAGFTAAVLHFGLKIQSEAALVLEGYARAERNGLGPFTFYHPVEACAAILARHLDESGGSATRRFEVLNTELDQCRVSATQALSLHKRGVPICHSVYAVGGALTPGQSGQPVTEHTLGTP